MQSPSSRPQPPLPTPKRRWPRSGSASSRTGARASLHSPVRLPASGASWPRCAPRSSGPTTTAVVWRPDGRRWPIASSDSGRRWTRPNVNAPRPTLRCRRSGPLSTPRPLPASTPSRRWVLPSSWRSMPRPITPHGRLGSRRCRWRSTRLASAPVRSTWPGWTGCSAPCWTWSRSTPAGRTPSKPPPARPSARSWWPMSTPPADRWHPWDRVTTVVQCWRSRASPAAPPHRRRSGSRCAATSGRCARGGDATGLERVLDALLSSAVAIDGGWEEAVPVAAQHPVGSGGHPRPGDRFGISGWRIGAASSGATGAALEEATARSSSSLAERDRVRALVERARVAVRETRQTESGATRERDVNESLRRSLADAARRLSGDADEARAELEALGAHLGELVERHARETARVAELEALLPQLDAAEAEIGAEGPGDGHRPGAPRGAQRSRRVDAHRPGGSLRRRGRASPLRQRAARTGRWNGCRATSPNATPQPGAGSSSRRVPRRPTV